MGTFATNDTINFESVLANGTITLSSGELNITKDVIINGIDISIDAHAASRVMIITDSTVSINQLTLANWDF